MISEICFLSIQFLNKKWFGTISLVHLTLRNDRLHLLCKTFPHVWVGLESPSKWSSSTAAWSYSTCTWKSIKRSLHIKTFFFLSDRLQYPLLLSLTIQALFLNAAFQIYKVRYVIKGKVWHSCRNNLQLKIYWFRFGQFSAGLCFEKPLKQLLCACKFTVVIFGPLASSVISKKSDTSVCQRWLTNIKYALKFESALWLNVKSKMDFVNVCTVLNCEEYLSGFLGIQMIYVVELVTCTLQRL